MPVQGSVRCIWFQCHPPEVIVHHYSDVIMSVMASQINSLTMVYSTVYSCHSNMKATRHWPLCGNSPMTGEFLAQMASNAQNVSISWRHHHDFLRHICQSQRAGMCVILVEGASTTYFSSQYHNSNVVEIHIAIVRLLAIRSLQQFAQHNCRVLSPICVTNAFLKRYFRRVSIAIEPV